MARRKQKQPKRAAALELAGDFGPKMSRDRGDVEIVQAPDPDAPNRTIKRARRVVVYDVLNRTGTISDEQREAADRYLVTAITAGGGTWRPGDATELLGGAHWQKSGPPERQLRAMSALRRANTALGPGACHLIQRLVLDNKDLAALAAYYSTNTQVVRGMVVAALTRLAEQYGIDSR